MQLVNVAFGGTLNQHVEIDEGVGHPQWDVTGAPPPIRSFWSRGRSPRRCYRRPGASTRCTTRPWTTWARGWWSRRTRTDGVIEGLETPAHDLLAVQWHPELLAKPDPTFEWVVGAAATRRA